MLGIFTTEAYTHFTPGWGGVLVGCFVASVGVLMAVVARTYPDRVSTVLCPFVQTTGREKAPEPRRWISVVDMLILIPCDIQPSAPRTFPGGLEAELGGPTAVRARMSEDEVVRV